MSSLSGSGGTRVGCLSYQVQDGDNLSRIAERFGIELVKLEIENQGQFVDRDRLLPGTTIFIPLFDIVVTPFAPAPAAPTKKQGVGVGKAPPSDDRLGLGRDNDAAKVRAVQELLVSLGHPVSVTGVYDQPTKSAVWRFQKESRIAKDGLVGDETLGFLKAAVAAKTAARPSAGDDGTVATPEPAPEPRPSPGTWTPNKTALERARASAVGQRLVERTPLYAETYRRVEALTGVPAELVAALHANESGQHTAMTSVLGPEAGFGLDPRWVTTTYGNGILRAYRAQAEKLGIAVSVPWQRGKDTTMALLQSAVIAAEHLKRLAAAVDVKVARDMPPKDVAGAITAYAAGPGAGRTALRRGAREASKLSWMFDLGDRNPHPLRPGGTSIGADGKEIPVKASRKSGLLRWDVLVPMLRELLAPTDR